MSDRMFNQHCGVYCAIYCFLINICQVNAFDLCSDGNITSACCPCFDESKCNIPCPDGFEALPDKRQDCVSESNSTAILSESVVCRRCPGSFFIDIDNSQHCCHPACSTCTGPEPLNCTTCTITYNDACVAECPDGYDPVEDIPKHNSSDNVTEAPDSSAPGYSKSNVCSESPKDSNLLLILGIALGCAVAGVVIIVCLIVRYKGSKAADISSIEFNNIMSQDEIKTDKDHVEPESVSEKFNPEEEIRVQDIPTKPATAPAWDKDLDPKYQPIQLGNVPSKNGSSKQSGSEKLERGYDEVTLKNVPNNISKKQKGNENTQFIPDAEITNDSTQQNMKANLEVYQSINIDDVPVKTYGDVTACKTEGGTTLDDKYAVYDDAEVGGQL